MYPWVQDPTVGPIGVCVVGANNKWNPYLTGASYDRKDACFYFNGTYVERSNGNIAVSGYSDRPPRGVVLGNKIIQPHRVSTSPAYGGVMYRDLSTLTFTTTDRLIDDYSMQGNNQDYGGPGPVGVDLRTPSCASLIGTMGHLKFFNPFKNGTNATTQCSTGYTYFGTLQIYYFYKDLSFARAAFLTDRVSQPSPGLSDKLFPAPSIKSKAACKSTVTYTSWTLTTANCSYTSGKVTFYDPSGQPLVGFTDMNVPTTSPATVTLTSFPSMSHLSFEVDLAVSTPSNTCGVSGCPVKFSAAFTGATTQTCCNYPLDHTGTLGQNSMA